MNTANHISDEDLTLFALALMPREEAAFTLAHLKDCDLCRSEVARIQGDLAIYAMTAEMQDAPAESRTRLLNAVAREKKTTAIQPAAEPIRAPRHRDLLDRHRSDEVPSRRGIGFFGWSGWAVAAGLAAVGAWQFQQTQTLRGQVQSETAALDQAHKPQQNAAEVARGQQVLQTLTNPAAMQVALHLTATPGAPKPEGHAAYVADQGALVFVASHLRPIEPGKTYELWLLPAGAAKPVPAGLFRPDEHGNASVVLPTLPRNIAAKGFGVTIENEGGSAAPTPPIVLAGTQS